MSKKYNYDYIQFKVSPEEKKEIKDMKKKHRYSTMSDFIREAIRDKINRLENPEVFSKGPGVNNEMMSAIYKNTKKMVEIEELKREKETILNEMRETLRLIRENTSEEGFENDIQKVNDLLDAHGSLKPVEIMERIDTIKTRKQLFAIISDLDTFELTNNGRVKKR